MTTAWLLSVALVASGCGRAERGAAEVAQAPDPREAPEPEAARIERGSITLTIDPRVATSFVPHVVPACTLDNPTDKPDGVAPAHLAFRFTTGPGASPSPTACGVPDFTSPGLYVFPVDGYQRALPMTMARFQSLLALLSAGASAPGQDVAFVPCIDASPGLTAQVSFIEFAGGKGVLYLTELVIEPADLGDRLAFVFQGLSTDGRQYVLGIFPATTSVRIPPLPGDPHPSYEAAAAEFEPYRTTVEAALDAATADDFTPSPAALRRTLRSLELPAAP